MAGEQYDMRIQAGYARLSSSPRMVAFLYDTLQRILHEDVAGVG